ncbi:semaphorin-7A-like [Brachyistius frenatus]|uniref:semaphorin-7A-like n=1 Tax=Brachyistius frenatus TaxID=100188 RepID=UPI0037E7E8C1
MDVLTLCLMLWCLGSGTEANPTCSPPRMLIEDTKAARVLLPEHRAPVQILLGKQPDTVIAAGQTHLTLYDFQNPEKELVQRQVLWKVCTQNTDCNYNITVVKQKDEDNQVFVCGTNGKNTVCCIMNISEQSPVCMPSVELQGIRENIMTFIIKEGEQSALVESEGSADFYITHSGPQDYVGLYRFGRRRLRPIMRNEEQHYVGLVLSRQRDNPLQDKVYTFYKQRNRDKKLDSDMWIPFVSRVCMSDVGGPKNSLQFLWTSQINARLFCGNTDRRYHFSELVDVATVHADNWQDTKIYGLFINEWGMSAVCVYTVRDISNIFATSPFKVSSPDIPTDRPRTCVEDSTNISPADLGTIRNTFEVEQWVQPMHSQGPILINCHNYTRIHIDGSSQRTVLFLSLNNGGIHKVIQDENQTFIVNEVRPFTNRTHLLSVILHASSRKLYVNSRRELVQLNTANCAQYGNTCQDCVLSRDPYCGWNKTHCAPKTTATKQDMSGGTHAICGSQLIYLPDLGTNEDVISVSGPLGSQISIFCPVSSRHAQYTWNGGGSSTACSSLEERCLLLIDSMSPEKEGAYECVSEEEGYKKIMARYQVKMGNGAAGRQIHLTVWVCLVITSLFC